jgi:hypothetical protein
MRSASLPLTSTSRMLMFLAVVLVALLAGQPAQAQEPPFARAIEDACREGARNADPFVDVDPDAVHGEAIACIQVYGIAQGRIVGEQQLYAPAETVTREQMASFVQRTLAVMPDEVFALPEPSDAALFDDADDISSTHIRSVNALVETGIVQGYGDDTFRPQEPVDRAQMATFIVGAIEAVTGDELERAAVFDDISGVHQANIEKLASIGVTAGQADGVYAPAGPITRAQMGSFLARSLDYLAAQDLFEPIAFDPGSPQFAGLGLVDVDLGDQGTADRVTFTFDGDDGEAGWRVRYVDEAVQQGSGNVLDIEGAAILELNLTGMALPPDLPPDIEDDVVVSETFPFDGEGIVEVEVGSVFEGQQQIFIGTTGRQPFTVERLPNPQRVYIDVEHAP